MNEKHDSEKRQITEEVMVKGEELVEFVKMIVKEGNVRRLVVRKPDGEALLEIPLTTGLAASGVVTLLAPVLAALGALGALLAGVQVQIIRSDEGSGPE
jgi:hypothetical protein